MKFLTIPTTADVDRLVLPAGAHEVAKRTETMPWCCKCVVEYDVYRASVRLQPERKTERYAFAKALNATGGVRLGRAKR